MEENIDTDILGFFGPPEPSSNQNKNKGRRKKDRKVLKRQNKEQVGISSDEDQKEKLLDKGSNSCYSNGFAVGSCRHKYTQDNGNSDACMNDVENASNLASSILSENFSSSSHQFKTDSNSNILPDFLPSEPQEGNIEYKLKLLNPNNERFKRLVSQMQWRLREGLGEAIYEIGVEDSGHLQGLSPKELEASMTTLKRMAKQLGASLTVIREKNIIGRKGQKRKVAEVLVRKVPDDQYSIEIRIAVVGNSDVGKSTLLGVLTRGELDNGRGCARLNVFRHRHEVYSGKTSSISLQIMGFDSEGHVIDQTCTRSRDYDDEDICKKSTKIINFIDLAGDQKYLHTTAFGLSGYCPHYALLVVSAFCGVAPMTFEHINLARAFDVPIIIVVTKTDICNVAQTQRTLTDLQEVLTRTNSNAVPRVMKSVDDAITAGSSQLDSNVVPIFCVSSVSGDGLSLLKKYLFVLPPKISSKERQLLEQDPAEFQIDEVFHVDDNCIVGGLLTKGVIMQGSSLLLGPFDNCGFKRVRVLSIHRNKVPCRVVYAGQSSSLSISPHFDDQSSPLSISTHFHDDIRKGMKLLHEDVKPKASIYFQARLRVLRHDNLICKGFQTTVHIGNIRQTAVVEAILEYRKGLRINQEASVILRFIRHPEYVTVGSSLLFRTSNTTGTGKIVQVFGEETKHS